MTLPKVRRLWALMALVALVAGIMPLVKLKGPGWLARYREWMANRPVHAQLDRVIPLQFPQGVPLDQFLVFVQNSTKTPTLPPGLRIVIDPVGLQEAGLSMKSTVRIDAQSSLLRVSLRESLSKLGLSYMVKGGMVIITARESMDEEL